VKASNFQRNGSVQASVEEQFIKAGKELYNLRRQDGFTQNKQPYGKHPNVLKVQSLTTDLQKAWEQFNALEEKVKQTELQLSSDALKIKEFVYRSIDLNSPPPPIMKG
jgi:hypothetical protein